MLKIQGITLKCCNLLHGLTKIDGYAKAQGRARARPRGGNSIFFWQKDKNL